VFETIFVVDVPVGPGLCHKTGIESMYHQKTAEREGRGCSLHISNPKKDNRHPPATIFPHAGKVQYLKFHEECFASKDSLRERKERGSYLSGGGPFLWDGNHNNTTQCMG
jgi:hypothetical protein